MKAAFKSRFGVALKVGDVVQFRNFGGWMSGTIVKLGRTKVHIRLGGQGIGSATCEGCRSRGRRMKSADPKALDAAVREAVGGDYRVTSTAIACGRRVAGKRTASRVFIVEGPNGLATVIREDDGFELFRWGSGV